MADSDIIVSLHLVIPFISMVLTVIVIVISQSNLSHHVRPPLLFVNVGVYSENFFCLKKLTMG